VAASTMADTLVSLGDVGVLNFTCPKGVKENVIAVAFDDLYSGEASIPVSNLVQTTTLAVGDKLYIYNGGSYKGYTLADGGIWEPITSNFTLTQGGLSEDAGKAADKELKAAGQGFWIVRQDATAAATVTVYGKPPAAGAKTLAQGRNLCGNPTNTAKFPTITNPSDGDIIILNGEGQNFTKGKYKSGAWKWNTGSAPTIPALGGFWYTAQGSTTTLAW